MLTGVDGPWQALRNGDVWQQGSPLQTFLAASVQGVQKFDREGQLPLDEGTLELRVSLAENGDSDTYTQTRTLFSYKAANGDSRSPSLNRAPRASYISAALFAANGKVPTARAVSCGPGKPVNRITWQPPGLLPANRMRFYLDGVLTADTNEGHYWPPASTGDQFTLDTPGTY